MFDDFANCLFLLVVAVGGVVLVVLLKTIDCFGVVLNLIVINVELSDN